MNKLSLFRALNDKMPVIAERVIRHWGTPDLDSHIDTMIREAPKTGLRLTDELIAILNDLKAVHLIEFPHFASLSAEAVRGQLAGDANFQTVEAAFPHVAEQIVSTWGRTAFHWYIDGLFHNDRAGHRQGFPEPVVIAIFRLTQRHDELHPNVVPKDRDLWGSHNEL